MILPSFTLPVKANNFQISWYDHCYSEKEGNLEAKYIVYISTTGRTIEDFTTPLLHNNATSEWVKKTVDLSSFAGKTINIAFQHNDKTEKTRIEIRDFRVEGSIIRSINFIIDQIKTQLKTIDLEKIEDNFIGEVNNSINKLSQIGHLDSTNLEEINSSVYNLNEKIYNEIQNNLYQEYNLSIHEELSTLLSLAVIKDIDEMTQRLMNLEILFEECYKLIKILPNVSDYFNEEGKGNNGLRYLSMNTRSVTCKLDDIFSDDMTLIANPDNLETFILISNKNYNITLDSDL